MSNTIPLVHPPGVLFLGMQGNFSYPPLQALLDSGIEVCAVVIPATQTPGLGLLAIRKREHPRTARSMLPLLQSSQQTSILQLAWERDIPVWEVHRLSDPEAVSILATYQSDIICVVCFSQLVPRVILDLPRFGCFNVHPSLLPANRGPVPLFWTFREGQQQTGVTIHLMDEGMDTGDIMAQQPIQVPSGISYAQMELQCATLGGELLVRAVWDSYRGLATRTPQDEAQSSYHPFPSEEDFAVDVAQWSAQHVYDFVCGVASWGGPVTLQAGNESFIVQHVISYSHKDIRESKSASQSGVQGLLHPPGCGERCLGDSVEGSPLSFSPNIRPKDGESSGEGEAFCWRGEELWLRCKVGWIRIK